MILIPEIQTVLILVPRTGSGTLRRAVAARYPRSQMIYRHMEACGVPRGYDHWHRVGVVRHPLDRLWSLYKFMRDYSNHKHDSTYVQSLNDSTKLTFSDWIVGNQTVFSSPYDRSGYGQYLAEYTVNHPIPENQKSQFLYLRPDLGTRIVQYENLSEFASGLDLNLMYENKTSDEPMPFIAPETWEYVRRVFAWDLEQVLVDKI